MQLTRIGLTAGDINGIGLEVILKTFSNFRLLDYCIPVIYASSKVVSYHKNILKGQDLPLVNFRNAENLQPGKINIVNCWSENVNISLGQVNEEGGKYAYISLDAAVRDLKDGYLDALVTAPIHKQAMQLASFPYKGHTDFLTQAFEAPENLMLMVDGSLRIGVVTDHVALRDVPDMITPERLKNKLNILIQSLQRDFGIEKPTVAVLGLNPHASDDGLMGDEENNTIIPVIQGFKAEGHLVMGPYPADGFFGSLSHRKFDAILAMYHDQGLIPFKTMAFATGVNYTAGLPVVRTSPGHGTAFDLAGKNEADPSSYRAAVYLAMDLARNRRSYDEARANALTKKPKLSEDDDSDS
ncbi:MAG: 4-hydroxythreonine-4-phosphate dehydrogenase PdxA [Lewinellaceae bacterium]|nr:4-hydroxythreonine-4-phosphate dehydrogenase PdxA [Lewinellaceae bacterium]